MAVAPRPTPLPRNLRTIRVVGVPMDLGASRRGVDMGPSAVRLADLTGRLVTLGHAVDDRGNVAVPDRANVIAKGGDLLGAIAGVCACVAPLVADAIRDGATPLVLGGDHSLAVGSVAGSAAAMAERGSSVGVIWLDAHADLHTPESSETGNVHGMPVAHLLGRGDPRLLAVMGGRASLAQHNLAYVGLRDLDPGEQQLIHELGIHAFTMRDIDERGLRAVMADAIAIASDGTGGIHLSCDADWVDPGEAPGVGTPVRGGATLREAHLAMEMVSDTGRLIAMDLVEINPILDRHNRTAVLAVDLIASAFGHRIL